jgi:hypothetical protein
VGDIGLAPIDETSALDERNAGQTGNRDRRLLYFPIVHTAADMGSLGTSIRGRKLSTLGRQGLKRNAALVEEMWARTESQIAALPLPVGTVRIYQDGLPLCGREREIVSDLARAGSRNHRLLLQLQARGATLMGTESPELLVEEYQLATAAFASGAQPRTAAPQQHLRDALLEKRDRFIAQRINTTLASGECGILFLGMLHDAARFLDSDIHIVYSRGLPRIGQRRHG